MTFIITARNSSDLKVMFLQACVKNSVHGGCIPGCNGQGDVYPNMQWVGGVFTCMQWAGWRCLPRGVCLGMVCLSGGLSTQGGYLPRGCVLTPLDPKADAPPLPDMTIEVGGMHLTGMHLQTIYQLGSMQTARPCGQKVDT